MKKRICFLIFSLSIFLFYSANASALTTEELIALKKAGVSEELIVFIVQNNYNDVDKISRLKEAGFKDETILSIIKSELGNKSAPATKKQESMDEQINQADKQNVSAENINLKTKAKIKILMYMIYEGQNIGEKSDSLDDATVYFVDGKTLKIEWKEKDYGFLNFLAKRPFRSPFYWDISKDDIFAPVKDEYRYMLRSAVGHKGQPETDDFHYWIIYLDPQDQRLSDLIKGALAK